MSNRGDINGTERLPLLDGGHITSISSLSFFIFTFDKHNNHQNEMRLLDSSSDQMQASQLPPSSLRFQGTVRGDLQTPRTARDLELHTIFDDVRSQSPSK
jgi:hypothetical protein